MSQWQGMFLRGKHAWTCLLRVLATWDFHATVAKGKEEALEPSPQSGFQQPGFWITMLGFRIPLAGFRIPKPWIPDSTDQNYLDSGFRITLHGEIWALVKCRSQLVFSLLHRNNNLYNSIQIFLPTNNRLMMRNVVQLCLSANNILFVRKYWSPCNF